MEIPLSPKERNFEKAAVDGDIAKMACALGDLHERWESLESDMRMDILKMDAIFLSMLNARVKTRNPES
jgi:hypothetical protein